MATIITVHGTNATGPEQGTRWWQQGGVLDTHLRQWVEGENGAFVLQPMIWDGANSESSRRAAAEKLLSAMDRLESVGEPYCVVGHSHGGSVAVHALRLAASQQKDLPGLARCVTVGTPFIKFSRSRWLFTRSKLLEKAVMTAMGGFAFLFFCFLYSEGPRAFGGPALFLYALLSAPLLASYIWLRVVNARRFVIYRPDVLQHLARLFAPRLLSLRHEDDEAIGALRSVRRLHIPFFARDFAVPALSFLALWIVPVTAILLTQSGLFMKMLADPALGAPELTDTWLGNVGQTVFNLAMTLAQKFYHSLYPYRPPGDPFAYAIFFAAVVLAVVLPLVAIPVVASCCRSFEASQQRVEQTTQSTDVVSNTQERLRQRHHWRTLCRGRSLRGMVSG